MLFGVECFGMASTVLTKRGKVAITEILSHLVEMLYMRCSLLSLFSHYRPRRRSDWLEYKLIRQVTSSPLSLVSRETYRKKRVPMAVGTDIEMVEGTRQVGGLSLQGTLEIEL